MVRDPAAPGRRAGAAGPAALRGGTRTGVLCGAGAGALWGLVFLAPALLPAFSPLVLAIGRFLCYGVLAAALLAPRWRTVAAALPRGQWLRLAWLAFVGNLLYYVLLSAAIQSAGIAVASLVIGFLPVSVTVIGSRDRGALPLRRLLPSLLAGAAGIGCIGWQALSAGGAAPGRPAIGLLCAVGALAAWTAYAVGNARSLRRLGGVSAHDWSLLAGIATGAQSLALLPVALLAGVPEHCAGEWLRFGAVSLGIAVLASILGNALWNRMSRLLPLTMVGQMILFETLFALLYGLAWERRLPTPWELAALGFVASSVLSCLSAHRRAPPSPVPPASA
ncbi:MAG: DMT family transporter [Xylophilus ampelinus]